MKLENPSSVAEAGETNINQDDNKSECQLTPENQRRNHLDRRSSNSFLNWRHLSFQGRRKHIRRAEDRSGLYVDRYESELFFVVVGVVLLSSCDAFLTLILLQRGAIELNALMAVLITNDIQMFVNLKLALTSLSLILLVIYKNFKVFGRFRVYHILWLTLYCYGFLILYEITLLNRNLYVSS